MTRKTDESLSKNLGHNIFMVDNPSWTIGRERLVDDNVAQKRGDCKKRLEHKKAIKRAIEEHVTTSRALSSFRDEKMLGPLLGDN